jgi:hypothetical protein
MLDGLEAPTSRAVPCAPLAAVRGVVQAFTREAQDASEAARKRTKDTIDNTTVLFINND